ncbi:hypothetical protein CPB84DRAFT_1793138 [Gymnopilus junonius]|uniref:Uncharacterized protein n=1 Tax=Gymnopilus junonius TaxID=109634 RepID=A0A9P5TIM1_GYMJU|nr:hypothetical protein CPB84DRAFT_1793138 [Gymnopilus junonius]
MYTNLQRQQQYQQAQILHQPQAQHYQEYPPPLQQRQHQLLQSPYGSQSSKLDVDSLTSSLTSTQLSSKSPATRLAQPQKPSPISATTSSGSTTTSSSLSDHSRTSTSASSVSQSPIQPSIHHQQHTHSQQPSLQHHPNHPGPITLPPRRPPAFPGSPHTPSASGLSISPLHHPGMVSPYHMYSSSAAVYQHHPQLGPITPHGLPPITPSMPPFYLPPSSHAMMQQQQLQNYSSASSQRRSFANALGSAPLPPMSTASASSSSASAAADTQTQRVSQPDQQQFPHQNPFAANQAQAFMVPLPSPGLYGIPSQQPQPSPPIHQPHLRLNLSGIPTTFSPGVSMSPGTFYGRQRDGLPMPNANPFINAAVGAPVHLHSPEGMPIPPGHPAAMVAHGHHPPAMQPPTPNMSHGAYFYAMSGAKKDPPSAMEPKGYFDPMYFPASVAGGIGASALANEILQDKVAGSSSLREGVVRGGKGKESEKDKDKEGGSNSSNTDSSDTAGGGDSGREGNTSHPRRRPKAVEMAPTGGDTSVAPRPKEDATTVLRTRSVGHASKAETVPTYAHWQSDPNIRTAPALSEESAGSVLRQALPLRLPSSPLLNRRTKTTGQIPQAMEDPTVTSLSPSTSIPPPQSPSAQ